jgi:hypothetical protein
MMLQSSYTSVRALRALRAAQRRAPANGRTCLRAARSAGHYRRLPLDAPRRFRAHSRVQMHTRAPLARHRYHLPCHRAHCIVRLRWTSSSSAGRRISCIRACEDARLGVSSGELSGREGRTFFFPLSCGSRAHEPDVVYWIVFFFDAKHEALNTVMDWRRELVRWHMN